MTPEQRAKNAQILYSSLNRSGLVNIRSFENVVASALRDAVQAERERAVEFVRNYEVGGLNPFQVAMLDAHDTKLADALKEYLEKGE